MSLADYIFNKPVIETGRLKLRVMSKEDLPSLKRWISDESIYRYWGKRPSKAEKNPELLFRTTESHTKSFHLGIEEKESGALIGDLWVHLIVNDRMANVAIRLSPDFQGRGYGTEALSCATAFVFENTELKRLQAEVDVRNVPSWKMFEKCGYRREGLIRQGKMVNVWCDYYIYGILSSDFFDG